MRGTWSRQAGSPIHCSWEKCLKRYHCTRGRDDFFDAEQFVGEGIESPWIETDPNVQPEMRCVQLPDIGESRSEWHKVDEQLTAQILEDEAGTLQLFGVDACCICSSPFLGLKTPECDFSLYDMDSDDMDSDDDIDDAWYSSAGLGMLDVSRIGEMCSDDDKICLLYTSPSPRDGLLSRMPSSA